MLLIKAIILFLIIYLIIGMIAVTWGGFWAFVYFMAIVLGAYGEWLKNK